MFARLIAIAAVAVFISFGASSPVVADELEFVIESQHPNVVQVEFYSEDYDRAWPGGGEAYVLDDYETKSITLACEAGERICYGAWVAGDADQYWGVGPDNQTSCSDCCYVCAGGYTETIVLTP